MKNSNYTLITSLGTGMYKTEQSSDGYRYTDYYFDDTKHFKTRLFMEALIKTRYKNFDEIIIIGTKTSSWDALVDLEAHTSQKTEHLWERLTNECEGNNKSGITDESQNLLQEYLKNRFSIPVLIFTHTDSIDNSTSIELLNLYLEAIKKIKPNNDILFDITHGFRSMPVLLYQALQTRFSNTNNKIEVVYGEYNQDTGKSIVRNLSNYWKYSEITNAINVFQEKLDGTRLAKLIENDFIKLSKALLQFTEIVQTNFALQIDEVIKQINNAIDDFEKSEHEAKTILLPIIDELKTITKLIDAKSKAKTLFAYAQYLYEHHLNVQAIITLQITVETAIAESEGDTSKIGNYDWWQDKGRERLNAIKNQTKQQIAYPLNNLEAFRNQIAHGGGTNKQGIFPNTANIPGIYNSAIHGIENLFKELGL